MKYIYYKGYYINLDNVDYISPVYEIIEGNIDPAKVKKYGSMVSIKFKNGGTETIQDKNGDVKADAELLRNLISDAIYYNKGKE